MVKKKQVFKKKIQTQNDGWKEKGNNNSKIFYIHSVIILKCSYHSACKTKSNSLVYQQS